MIAGSSFPSDALREAGFEDNGAHSRQYAGSVASMANTMATVTYEGRDLEVLADMPNYYAWIMDYFGPLVRGRVVEYGAGRGTVSERLLPLADMLTLVEPSPNLAEHLQERFAGQQAVTVQSAMLEQHVDSVPPGTVDTIVMVNILEHVERDEQALAKLLRALAPGGALLIFVPALQFLMAPLDRMHGHFRRYHRPDLTAKVAAAGGKVEFCRYFDFPGVAPWLLLNKVLGSTTFNPALVKIYDRGVVPLARQFESFVPPPFGKNLILAARPA
jgi:SAM-dependent methyltransferase